MEDILIPLAPFLMVLGIVIAVNYWNHKNRREVQETVREAVRAGQPVSPELVASLGVKREEGGDLKSGLILVAVAVGLLALGWAVSTGVPEMQEEEIDLVRVMAGVAAIPGFIGVVLVIFGLFRKNTDDRGPQV